MTAREQGQAVQIEAKSAQLINWDTLIDLKSLSFPFWSFFVMVSDFTQL